VLRISAKVKTVTLRNKVAHKGSGGIPILNIDLGFGRELSGQRHAPATLPTGKRPGAHCTTGWGRYGQVRKISPPPPRGFETRTAKPLTSRYTAYTTPVPIMDVTNTVELAYDVIEGTE